jgi:hypothetical protein
MAHGIHPASTRRPVVGWLVSAIGWIAGVILLIAGVALTTGPIRYWADELAPAASGGLGDNVITAAICAGLIAGFGAIALFVTRIVRAIGLRLRTWRAEQTLARDPRPPVLYLRSFRDDEGLSSASESFEQSLASVLSDIGPVIAVGRPGERLPPQGAARLYLSDEGWQPAVRDLMARSALTILGAGTSPGVLWELTRVVELVPPTRFLIAVPPALRSRDAERWKQFCTLAAEVMPHPLPASLDGATFVTFDPDWKPSVVSAPEKASLFSARAGVRNALRHFCERNGFRLRRRSLSDISVETLLLVALAAQAGSLARMPSDLHWRELSAAAGVTISMPGKHFEKRTTMDVVPGVQGHMHEVGVLKRDRKLEFTMNVVDYTVAGDTNLDFTANTEGAFQGARDAVVRQVKGKLLEERSVEIGSYAGREWRIDVPEREMVVRTRMFIAGPRRTLSLFVAMPANGSEDEAGRQFLDSFQLR